MPLVIDASVAVAWLFKDEQSDVADRAIIRALREGVTVPAIFEFELANSIAVGVRSSRVAVRDIPEMIESVDALHYGVAEVPLTDLAGPVQSVALQHRLSVYDASYLYLALRQELPLATLDRRLRAAAAAAGCEVFA